MMHIKIFFHLAIVFVCFIIFNISSGWGAELDNIAKLLDDAETHIKLGVVDKGAGRSFLEAGHLVKIAEELLGELDSSQAEKKTSALEVEMIQKRLKFSPNSMKSGSTVYFLWRG